MKRLTRRNESGKVLIPLNPDETNTVELVFEKLATYEDSGMEPKEIIALRTNSETF